MAQTAAAPLAPTTHEADAIYFLEYFNVKHMILFEGNDNPGLYSAFHKYAATGRAKLHTAVIRDYDKPGLFEYLSSGEQRLDPGMIPIGKALVNPPDGVGLLRSG